MLERLVLQGFTPLHLACIMGHTTVVNLLLQHDADIDICDKVVGSQLGCSSDLHSRVYIQHTLAVGKTSCMSPIPKLCLMCPRLHLRE